ncbi:mismatched base pair and cruciform DNA recognition protein [Mycena latifolia]|nr:mismatched base pair and cruciform DNA recognition protein [Mycena latifolia]KAJ7480625.1 mismatched base pair and cruciform DNA recognition protein [Mycena latifolia]
MSTNDLHKSNGSMDSAPQPSKMAGQYHSVKGTLVEMIGHMTGATSWQSSGREEHMAGEAEIQAAEAQAYVQGTLDRAQGKVDAVVGAVTGDRARQMEGNLRHDMGKANQEANKLA